LEFGNVKIRDRFDSNFRKIAVDYVTKNYSNWDFWDYYYDRIVDMKTGKTVIQDFCVDKRGSAFERDFRFICEWLEAGNTLKPTEKEYNETKAKWGYLFDGKTYVMVTRNFENKQPETNTHRIVNLQAFVSHLTENNIRIINIGFPPSHLNIQTNYTEMDVPLSQGQLMSLMYMADGALLVALNCGYGVHMATNCDIFPYTRDWAEGTGVSMTVSRMKNKSVLTKDIGDYVEFQFGADDKRGKNKFDEVVKILQKHRKVSENLFREEPEVHWLNEAVSI
jgi:hypothetical protein